MKSVQTEGYIIFSILTEVTAEVNQSAEQISFDNWIKTVFVNLREIKILSYFTVVLSLP